MASDKNPTKKVKNGEATDESVSFTPREYQIEILEAAKKRNTIACLGTGTGKTFIAVMLIRESAKEVRKPFLEGGKRIFFLVPTVPLVAQQQKTIEDHTDLRVKGYFGGMEVDSWNKEQWINEFKENEVLVMTGEIFRVIVDHTFISLKQIQLLIIDECHRAQKDHPYRLALKPFVSLKPREMPRIFGLSASLLNGKCKPMKLESKLRELEITMQSAIVTASDVADIRKYGTDPNEYIVLYKAYHGSADELLKDTIKKIAEFEKEKSDFWNSSLVSCVGSDCQFFDKPLKSLHSLEKTLASLGPWCACKAAEVFQKEVQALLLRSSAQDFHSFLGRIEEFLTFFTSVCKVLISSSPNLNDSLPHKIIRLLQIYAAAMRSPFFQSNPVPLAMDVDFEDDPEGYQRILKENLRRSKDSQLCSIIFVEQRITAYVLCELLSDLSKRHSKLEFMKPQFVVGHGNPGYTEMSMSEKLQQKKLKEFRENRCNVLIATQVLEEGMDIRQCNLVVRFDPPKDFRAYVQSKGRARSKNSMYVMLMEEGVEHQKFVFDLCSFKTIEELLISKCHDRSIPSEEDILVSMTDDKIPPYMPQGPNGPRITMNSAISLINRYCSSLPSDMATKLVPTWKINVVDENNVYKEYECILQMPINSPIRKAIVSEPMRQKRLAKMCAALKACKILDEIGELNENLVPISCLVDKALEDELGEGDEEENCEGAMPGTNRRRQIYDKKVPIFLQNVRPLPGQICYLHVLVMDLVLPLPKELNPRNRPLLNPADTERGIALVLTKKLPPVNPFPIFTKYGKIMVTIAVSDTKILLTDIEIKKIEEFHHFIFTDAISYKNEKQFSTDLVDSAYYVVPVLKGGKNDFTIDWDFMDKTNLHPYHITIQKTTSTIEREVFNENNFTDAVVLRLYQNFKPDEDRTVHHVIKIKHDLSPSSSFMCDTSYKTFKEYFYRKYQVMIQNDNQPLIETVQSGGCHLWKPLYQSIKETFEEKANLSKTKHRHKNYREYLVPELSIIHPFPSSFFNKVLYLPTVLFRLNSFLLAEELRQVIACEASVGTANLPSGFSWPIFNLETSDAKLMDYFAEKGILKKKSSNVLVPRDIVKEGDKIVDFEVKVDLRNHTGPEPRVLVQALTPKSTGDEFNLERLELIGDSFLKYVMTVKIYGKYNYDEGKLTKLRIGLIQNATLYKCAKKKRLPQYMTTTSFMCSKTWLPPCYTIEETVDTTTLIKKPKSKRDKTDPPEPLHLYFTKQVISDKCAADCVEAMIGAYLLSCGQEGALRFMAWFGLNPLLDKNFSDQSFTDWPPPPPNPIVVEESPMTDQRLNYLSAGFDRFEESIGYKFKNRAYLLQALTHPSYIYNDITDCYQRLEFLGDAVLDYLITRQLYEDPSGHSPGKLTDLRSALVNNIYFAYLAVHYSYHKHLMILSPELFRQVKTYVQLLKESEGFKFFEEHLYMLEELECFELEEVEVPKALGDVFESVAGAIYLDSGMSLNAVWRVCFPMIQPAMKHLCQHVPISPVREFYEMVKTKNVFRDAVQKGDKTYIQAVLPDGRTFEGVGPNKKVAKRSAAKRAMATLKAQMDTSS